MFTQRCFIRKNSKKIQDLIYNLGNRRGTCLHKLEYDTLLVADKDYFRCLDDERDNDKKLIKEGFIDCGTNEELFLAIAALRDDTDENQWFVYPKGNHWFKCYDNNIEEIRNEPSTRMSCQAAWFYESHKATVEELINHFKKE